MPHDHDHDRDVDRDVDVDIDRDDRGPDTTLRLDGPDTTLRLDGPDADAGEATRATLLDPDSWSSRAAPHATVTAVPAAEPDGTVPQPPRTPGAAPYTGGPRRFGPGVPGPGTPAATARTAAVWHGTVRPGEPGTVPAGGDRRRRRALRGWLLPAVVLLGVLAYLAWQHFPSPVRLDGVAVRHDTAVQGCHSTARITGTLRTSGGAGTVRYRWRRSDGTVSDELRQHVAGGRRTTDVVLLWTFDGPGSLTATATLDVLAPQHHSASTTFAYHCG